MDRDRQAEAMGESEYQRCFFCKEWFAWYELEDHLDKHYEDGDFADRETESRLAQEGDKHHGVK